MVVKDFISMPLYSFFVLLFLCFFSVPAAAAKIDVAYDKSGNPLYGIIVEGDIESGDALKLQNEVELFNVVFQPSTIRTIFLRSNGGDVEEAMKIGAFIRKFRIETEVPYKIEGQKEIGRVMPINKNNNICASACFLVYAGGVRRTGNLLALHRPYLPKETANKITDVEYEVSIKETMKRVGEYLRDMEVDQFFIDKMMSHNSQDTYLVTLSDYAEHHLDRTAPSIEEVILAKCTVLNSQEIQIIDSGSGTQEQRKQLLDKGIAGMDCENKVLNDIREEAFKREMEKRLQESASP